MKVKFLLPVLLFTSTLMSGQGSMNEGFQLLESGSFEEAETYFDSYLETDPDNKTAQICYGRAVGLSGEPTKAIELFSELLQEYPSDFEVQINYNEAYLWDKQYSNAKPLYEELVANNPTNFGALLGYANTLSNLKEFESALAWVNKALSLQPENNSAKTSRKYIKLGFANTYITKKQYTIAEQLLNEIFIDFPEDKETLLNLANLYLITKNSERAKSAYLQLAKNPLDSIVALNGIALASHIGKNDKEALNIARIARTKVATVNDSVLANQTNERYIQALIWNSKYREADKQIDSLKKSAPNQNWVKALRATLGMYTANFKSSLDSYDAILLNDSTSFDGNLGMANALFASDRIIPAYEAAYKTLSHYENQADAQGFVEKLNSLHTPMLEEKAFYTFDNGKNVAVGNQISGSLPFSTKFRTTFSYQFRNTENTISQNKATSHVVLAGAEYKVFPQTKLKTVIGFNNASFGDRSYTQPILDARFQLQPMRLQNLEIGYQREVQNFNADLIEREIVMNHYGLNYNVSSNFNLGWYTQLMHTRQTDGNTRNLIFTSLYYNVLKSPVLKVGVNYQYIAFKDQLPSIYFSPEQYHATEVFADIRGSFSEKTRYMLSGATGFQKVESDDQSAIFRIEAQLKHQFTNRLGVDLYGKYSNIASATAAGFEFTEIGIKVKWAITKAPLFNKKLLALK